MSMFSNLGGRSLARAWSQVGARDPGPKHGLRLGRVGGFPSQRVVLCLGLGEGRGPGLNLAGGGGRGGSGVGAGLSVVSGPGRRVGDGVRAERSLRPGLTGVWLAMYSRCHMHYVESITQFPLWFHVTEVLPLGIGGLGFSALHVFLPSLVVNISGTRLDSVIVLVL
ncbi:hypothetical protein FXO37_02648 [Capsicum annuum]|nr:hypothetical protein FXO37_02648 [Capsicum annuum]